MAILPLEDNYVDVISKAQSGFKLSDADLARRSEVSEEELKQIKAGEWKEEPLRKVARALNLGKTTLVELASKGWAPEPVSLDGLLQFTTPFGDMTVNAYLIWDPATKDAVVFDTGAVAFGMVKAIQSHGLKLRYVLITHTHGDHIADLDRFRGETGVELYVSEKEPLEGVNTFEEWRIFEVGGLKIETRSTTGHSKGGTTYVVQGLEKPVAVVGDALFAASMGSGKVSFLDALGNNRRKIMILPGNTILCPGHGPMTTVAEEQKHNPFFPEFQK